MSIRSCPAARRLHAGRPRPRCTLAGGNAIRGRLGMAPRGKLILTVGLALGSLISVVSMAPIAALHAAPSPSGAGKDRVDSPKFARLSDEFVKESLVLSPSAASGAGYHYSVDRKTGKKVALDAQLDDMSLESMAKQRAFYAQWRD